jgi:hypothetical protein
VLDEILSERPAVEITRLNRLHGAGLQTENARTRMDAETGAIVLVIMHRAAAKATLIEVRWKVRGYQHRCCVALYRHGATISPTASNIVRAKFGQPYETVEQNACRLSSLVEFSLIRTPE